MFHLESPIPSISISPAPPKEPSPIEPQRSPYAVTLAPTHTESPRSQHLLPPPSPHHRSSAKPTIGISHGSGLDMAVFQALLQAAKGKEKDKGTKTSDGLKDSHHQVTSQRQTKQMERRARFLAKIAETPKACAMNTPPTPPESPVVFRLSPPSPRLQPPCETSHQESSAEGVTRVQQVNFVTKPREKRFLPSLELISQIVLINNKTSSLVNEGNRPNHSRNAATQALYDVLSKRQATTNKLPRQLPSHDNVGDVIRNRVLELRMKRQMVAGVAELMCQRPNSPGRKRSWAAGLNKKASLSDNYRQPFLPAAPTSSAATTTSHHTESPQQRNDFVMHPVRVVISPSVLEATTMDAFVDGMNGGEEDIFASMDALRGSRRRKKSLNHSSISSSNASFVHHPLYHPPLPKPPPGVKLGVSLREDSDADEDTTPQSTPGPRRISKRKSKSKQSISSKQSSSISSSVPVVDSIDDAIRHYVTSTHSPPKQPVPSINDIIRNYAPSVNQHKPALSVSTSSSPVTFPTIPATPPLTRPPSQSLTINRTSLDDSLSRSSMDSVAEEVRRTLMLSPPPSTASQRARASPGDDRDSFTTTIRRSDNINRSPSISSFSTAQSTPSPYENHFRSPKSDSNTHALATFLRSPRLTRLLKLRRHPNQRLQVSFSDLGSSSGRPVVVFLGLGCVRYIMGLYDEMAEALGLRLITIDRWGLGKTDNPPRGVPRGVKEWAAVVEEVLEYLNIDRYGILAHSAGAPYAMAFANRSPHKVKGDLCLLAPWVGPAEGGYKWLKYVPTSLIKTAQAAEWKVQAWMLGKPPAINTGIGYSPPPNSSDRPRSSFAVSVKSRESIKESRASSVFSDYDDLADFQGKYASHSTIHICDDGPSPTTPTRLPTPVESIKRPRSRSGRFFSGLWKSGEPSMSASPSPIKNSPTRPRLKVLKSMGSLRSNSVSSSTAKTKGTRSQTASLAGTIEDDWSALGLSPIASPTPSLSSVSRGNGRSRRSISLSSPKSPYSASNKHSTNQSSRASHRLSSPPPQSISSRQAPSASSFEVSPTSNGAALGNALLAASHAEASRGTHADLLQILNYDQKPWGFSYQDFPHNVKVWYGEKDEKIAEGAMRWLEKTMRPGTCELDIVKGAGHSLLYNGNVVVEALETLKGFWTTL